MSYKQLCDADMNVGYTGGMCLEYVQDAYHTDHIYPRAIDAWNANVGGGNHTDVPPLGITVPVFFSLGNVEAGHVAIRLNDGWVASSTQPGEHGTPYYHKSLDDLIAVYGQYNGGCTYLGWSEFVGSQRVVEFVPDVVTATDDEIRQAYQDILERPADDGGLAHYRAYTIDFVRNDLQNSQEYKDLQARKVVHAAQPEPNPVVSPIHNPDVPPVLPVETTLSPSPEPTPVTEPPVQPDAPSTPVTATPVKVHVTLALTVLIALVNLIAGLLKALNVL